MVDEVGLNITATEVRKRHHDWNKNLDANLFAISRKYFKFEYSHDLPRTTTRAQWKAINSWMRLAERAVMQSLVAKSVDHICATRFK